MLQNNRVIIKPPAILDPVSSKHLFIQAINHLSTRIQQPRVQLENETANDKYIILKLENEALDYIEQATFSIFNSILCASGDDQTTPEATLTMSYTLSSPNSSGTTSPNTSTGALAQTSQPLAPVSNLNEAEFKVRQILPR